MVSTMVQKIVEIDQHGRETSPKWLRMIQDNPKVKLRWPKLANECAKMDEDGPKLVRRLSQDGRMCQGGRRWSQDIATEINEI